MRSPRIPLILALVLLCFPTLASAQDVTATAPDGRYFVRLEGGPTSIDIPKMNGSSSVVDDFGFNFVRQPDNGLDETALGSNYGLTMGFPVNVFPGFIPMTKTSLDLSVFRSSVSADESSTSTMNVVVDPFGDYLTALHVDGSLILAGPDDIASPGQSVSSSFKAQMDLTEFHLAATGNVLSSPKSQATIQLGALYATLNQEYNVSQKNNNNARFHQLDEELSTDYFGLFLKGSYAYSPVDSLFIRGSAEYAQLYAHTKFNARQNINGVLNYNADDSESRHCWRAKAGLGVEYRFSKAILGLSGDYTYWSYAPGVDNPTGKPGTRIDLTRSGKAKIDPQDMDALSGQIYLTIPFSTGI